MESIRLPVSHKHILILISLLSFYTTSVGQEPTRMLFIIDSIPVMTDPEEWNEILPDDIADMRIVNNKDSLKLSGFGKFDAITYIFTKEYRNRPDSLKKIPSLAKLKLKNDVWNLNDVPYSGKYIDYYNSGRKLNEGALLNGKLDGELKVYFQNGNIKSANNYKDGMPHGLMTEYYKSGVLKQKREYVEGKLSGVWESFFPDGKIEVKSKIQPGNSVDTSVEYYSTGKVKRISIIKNGQAIKDPVMENINYLQTKVYESLRDGDTKNALKYCDKILRIDSLNETAHFFWGEILVKSFHFDEAIAEYDKVLKVEPLFKMALVNRAFARIKKYKDKNDRALKKNNKPPGSAAMNTVPIPKDEQEKICTDLQQAVYLDASSKMISEAISTYCH